MSVGESSQKLLERAHQIDLHMSHFLENILPDLCEVFETEQLDWEIPVATHPKHIELITAGAEKHVFDGLGNLPLSDTDKRAFAGELWDELTALFGALRPNYEDRIKTILGKIHGTCIHSEVQDDEDEKNKATFELRTFWEAMDDVFGCILPTSDRLVVSLLGPLSVGWEHFDMDPGASCKVYQTEALNHRYSAWNWIAFGRAFLENTTENPFMASLIHERLLTFLEENEPLPEEELDEPSVILRYLRPLVWEFSCKYKAPIATYQFGLDPPPRFRHAVTWKLVTEVMAKHLPERNLDVFELHPAGGMGDTLSIRDMDGPGTHGTELNDFRGWRRMGSSGEGESAYALGPGGHYVGRALMDSDLEPTVLGVLHALGLENKEKPPRPFEPSAVFTYDLMAEILAQHLMDPRDFQWRSAVCDTSGYDDSFLRTACDPEKNGFSKVASHLPRPQDNAPNPFCGVWLLTTEVDQNPQRNNVRLIVHPVTATAWVNPKPTRTPTAPSQEIAINLKDAFNEQGSMTQLAAWLWNTGGET